jgi:hypothetical protein
MKNLHRIFVPMQVFFSNHMLPIMKTINKFLSVLILAIPICVNAQSDVDALRYSQTSLAGTARFISMAGAFGALGGDFSSLAYNPAGLAIYRKSEFTFSPSLYFANTESSFLNKSFSENRFNFNVPNIGFVYSRTMNADKPGWKGWSLGIGMNRMNNFQAKSYFEGFNPSSSLIDYFLESANSNGGVDPENLNDFYEGLAYDAQLIYDTTNDGINNYMKDSQLGITQKRNSTTRGGVSEVDFSFGGNYNDLVYLGATVGVSSLRFLEESIFEEVDKEDNTQYLNKYSFEQNVTTRGTGINFKMGLIVRPADWIRIGGAFHTPTLYSMHDDYKNILKSDLTFGDYRQESPDGAFDYTLTTPFKAIGSLGFIIGKSGLVGVDYEFTDYSAARFDASGESFSDVNNATRTKYTTASNIRIGTEWRLNNLSLRGGYAMYGTPFNTGQNVSGADLSKTSITGGLGIRDQNYFIDFGYAYSQATEYFQPYFLSSQNVPGSKNKITTHNFTMTFGVKF